MPLRHIPNSVLGILVRIIRAFTPYTKEQFLGIAVKVYPKLKEVISRIIGEEVWKQGIKDIRDVIREVYPQVNLDFCNVRGFLHGDSQIGVRHVYLIIQARDYNIF